MKTQNKEIANKIINDVISLEEKVKITDSIIKLGLINAKRDNKLTEQELTEIKFYIEVSLDNEGLINDYGDVTSFPSSVIKKITYLKDEEEK